MLRRFAPRNDVETHTFAFRDADRARAMHQNIRPKKTEGVGNAGCPMHPQPRVGKVKTTRVSHHGRTEITRHSRTRMVLTAYFVLSPGTGLSCPRRRPRCKSTAACLTPASGRQDHTTSSSAFAPPVLRRRRVHRIPHPTLMTLRNAPLSGQDTRKMLLIWG